jgi:hypothetical protein
MLLLILMLFAINYINKGSNIKNVAKSDAKQKEKLSTSKQDNKFKRPEVHDNENSGNEGGSSGKGPIAGIAIAASALIVIEVLLYIFVLRFQNPNRSASVHDQSENEKNQPESNT